MRIRQCIFLRPFLAACAMCQHGARCAFGEGEILSIPGMNGGHHLTFGTKGDLVHTWRIFARLLGVQAGKQGCLYQRRIHRVAVNIRVRPVANRCLVTKDGRSQQFQRGVVFFDPLGEFDQLSPNVQTLHCHQVLGQGAGLIGADGIHRTERLDHRQPAHYGVAAGHLAGAQGQGEGQHDRQALGNGGDGQTERIKRNIHGWFMQEEKQNDCYNGRQAGHDDGHLAGHLLHLHLERGGAFGHFAQGSGNLPDFGRHPSGNCDCLSGPMGNVCGCVDHAGPLCQCSIRRDRRGGLIHPNAFTGQG